MNNNLNLNNNAKVRKTTQIKFDHVKYKNNEPVLDSQQHSHSNTSLSSDVTKTRKSITKECGSSKLSQFLDNENVNDRAESQNPIDSKLRNNSRTKLVDNTSDASYQQAVKHQHNNQSFPRSHTQGKRSEQGNNKTTTPHQPRNSHENHKNKLFTQAYIPQQQYQAGQHTNNTRNNASHGGKQHYYDSSNQRYPSTSPVPTMSNPSVPIHSHVINVPNNPASHHSYYQYHPPNKVPVSHPNYTTPSAPIPTTHAWAAPAYHQIYTIPNPVYEPQQVQIQYFSTYQHPPPPPPPVYGSVSNQTLTTQNQPHQTIISASPKATNKSPYLSNAQTNQQQQQHISPVLTPRQSKAIPIIDPNTNTPVHADASDDYGSRISNNDPLSNKVKDKDSHSPLNNNGKVELKSSVTPKMPIAIIDPAIREQEERERLELEQQQQQQQQKEVEEENKDLGDTQSNNQKEDTVDIQINDVKIDDNIKEVDNINVDTSSIIVEKGKEKVEVPIPDNEKETQQNQKLNTPSISKDDQNSQNQHKQSDVKPLNELEENGKLESSSTTPLSESTSKNKTEMDKINENVSPSFSNTKSQKMDSENNVAEQTSNESKILQYDPSFIMQFMPLCLETSEDLSAFQNINDKFNNDTTHQNNKRYTRDRNQNRNAANTVNSYPRSATGNMSLIMNQPTDSSLHQHKSLDARNEMGKFMGGRTLMARNSNSNLINNMSGGNIPNYSVPGYDMPVKREGSFSGPTNNNYNNNYNNNNNNNNNTDKTRGGGGYAGNVSSGSRNASNINYGNNMNNINGTNNNNKNRYVQHSYPGGPTIPYEQVAPLKKSENRWVPATMLNAISAATTTNNESTSEEELLSQEEIIRKVKGLLNKLTLEKFDSISDKIIEYASQSIREKDGTSLRTVIELIFEKACDESAFASMWAQLCKKLHEWVPNEIQDITIKDKQGQPICGRPLYSKYLLNRCQQNFEKGWKADIPQSIATSSNAEDKDNNDDKGSEATTATTIMTKKPETNELMMTDEYYIAAKVKRQGLGLIQFIGELFKREMLSTRIMYLCIKSLCDNGAQAQEEEVESLCRLLTTIGANLDRNPQTEGWVDLFFKRMKTEMYHSPHLSSRVKFKILDLFDLQKNNWVPRRNNQTGPKTIAEIHEEAEREKQREKEMLKRTANRNHGASRQQSYHGNGKPLQKNSLNDGWNTVTGANNGNNQISNSGTLGRNKANDLLNFGKADRSRTKSSVLGPSNSPFSSLNKPSHSSKATSDSKSNFNSKDTKSKNTSQSTTNMFSALGDDIQDEVQVERPKLKLLPRGATLTSNEDEGENILSPTENKNSDEDYKAKNLDNEQLNRRIKNTFAEYFEIGDTKELILDLKELDKKDIQPILAKQILNVVEMKESQVNAISNIITKLYSENILEKEVMLQAFQEFMEGFEDLIIDVPQSPKYVALLLVKSNIDLSDAWSKEILKSDPPSQLQLKFSELLDQHK
ncbi:unnamed protein product [Cunninghamella echinulata]